MAFNNQTADGTTSAYAENTCDHISDQHIGRNYLRVRGEYLTIMSIDCLLAELPPRTRRIQANPDALSNLLGTTSAYAENTPPWPFPATTPWNYLRVRGEYPK